MWGWEWEWWNEIRFINEKNYISKLVSYFFRCNNVLYVRGCEDENEDGEMREDS